MVNGQLVEENRGGTVTTYVSDTLGSVIQTRNAAGTQTSSTEFWPFGERRAGTGTNPSPWGFCGIWGYFRDALTRYYVRARVLRVDLARWLTVDPLWPVQMPYNYANSEPIGRIDPSCRESCTSWSSVKYHLSHIRWLCLPSCFIFCAWGAVKNDVPFGLCMDACLIGCRAGRA